MSGIVLCARPGCQTTAGCLCGFLGLATPLSGSPESHRSFLAKWTDVINKTSVSIPKAPEAIGQTDSAIEALDGDGALTRDARELLSSWMISQGYATGHGDTIEDLLGELKGQIYEERRGTLKQDCVWAEDLENREQELTRLREDITRKDEALQNDTELLKEAWGALNFILAFYEPGQRYLDTNAWKQAEASGRSVRAKLREAIDALSPNKERQS